MRAHKGQRKGVVHMLQTIQPELRGLCFIHTTDQAGNTSLQLLALETPSEMSHFTNERIWERERERERAESTQTDTSGCCRVSSVPVVHMYSRLTPALLLFLTSAWDLYTYLRHLGQWVVLTADMAADVLVHYGDVSFSWELDLAVMSTANKSSASLNTLIIATDLLNSWFTSTSWVGRFIVDLTHRWTFQTDL